jgi:hypothetical protein
MECWGLGGMETLGIIVLMQERTISKGIMFI